MMEEEVAAIAAGKEEVKARWDAELVSAQSLCVLSSFMCQEGIQEGIKGGRVSMLRRTIARASSALSYPFFDYQSRIVHQLPILGLGLSFVLIDCIV